MNELRHTKVPDSTAGASETLHCDRCGHAGAMALGGGTICQECYFDCNSCCNEFSKEDPPPGDTEAQRREEH